MAETRVTVAFCYRERRWRTRSPRGKGEARRIPQRDARDRTAPPLCQHTADRLRCVQETFDSQQCVTVGVQNPSALPDKEANKLIIIKKKKIKKKSLDFSLMLERKGVGWRSKDNYMLLFLHYIA